MELLYIRIASILIIAFAYMIYDLFNNRNVPTLLVYATLVYGAVLTVLYFNTILVGESLIFAAIILGIGYLIYKSGQLGAADVAEIAVISLILPIQSLPILGGIGASTLPFAISIIVDSGIVALIVVPLYYIPHAVYKSKGSILNKIKRTDYYKSVIIIIAYSVLALFLVYEGISTYGVLIMAILVVGVGVISLFEAPITLSMVKYVTFDEIEEEDIIAVNLMNERELREIKANVPEFGRLATRKVIASIKREMPDKRLPVYKNAIPFALPIFFGSVASLLFGNLILYIVPHLVYI